MKNEKNALKNNFIGYIYFYCINSLKYKNYLTHKFKFKINLIYLKIVKIIETKFLFFKQSLQIFKTNRYWKDFLVYLLIYIVIVFD